MLIDWNAAEKLVRERGCIPGKPSGRHFKIAGAIRRGKLTGGRIVTCTESRADMWHPVNVFRACREALGEKPIENWKAPKDIDTAAYGLDEEMIAEAIAADGIRPYWQGRRTLSLESLLRCVGDPADYAGGQALVISNDPEADAHVYPPGRHRRIAWADTRPEVRRAATAVADAGLAVLRMGPRGGWSRAELFWRSAARIGGRPTRAEVDEIASAVLPPAANKNVSK